MGLFSGSKRSTTNNQTNNTALEVGAQDGFVILDSEGVTYSQTDQGAINAAFQFAGEAGRAYLDYGAASLDFAGQAGSAAFEFAGEAGAAYGSLSREALARGLETAEAVNSQSITAITTATDRSLQFSAGAVERAFDAASSAQNSVDAATNRAIDSVRGAYGDAGELSQMAFISALDSSDASAAAMQSAFVKATDAIETANQSETAKLADKSLYVVAAVAALMVWRASA